MILQAILLINEFLLSLLIVIIFYGFVGNYLKPNQISKRLLITYSIVLAFIIFYSSLYFTSPLYYIIITICLLTYLHLSFSGTQFTKITISVIFLLVFEIVSTVATSIFVLLFSVDRVELNVYSALRGLLVLATIVTTYLLIEISKFVMKRQKYFITSSKHSNNVFLGLIFISLVIIFGSFFLVNQVGTLYLIQYLMIIVGMFIVVFIVLINHFFRNKEQLLKNEVELEEIKLSNQSHLNEAEYSIDIMKIEHDIKNHMISLKYLLENDSTNEAIDYIEKIEKIETTKINIQTSNNIVNAILNSKINSNKNIDFRVSTNIQGFTLNAHYLTILLGNIIDNAIEAVSKLPSKEKFIDIRLSENSQYCKITVINPFDGVIKIIKGRIYSLKRKNSRGLGLLSVKNITDEMGGKFKYSYNDNMFEISLLLPK